MKRVLFFLFLAGCNGGSGQILGASPSVLLGRTAQITVTGKDTHFTDDAKIDLGPGIAITSATASSSTSLQVTIDVANDAPVGAHDVRVDGALATAALAVSPPATIVLVGAPQRGAIVSATFTSVDPEHSLDGKGDNGFGVEVSFLASPGVRFELVDVTQELVARVAIDESAPLGPVDLELVLGGTHFPIPAAFTIVDGSGPTLEDTTNVTLANGAAFAWIDPLTPLAWVRLDAAAATGMPSMLLLDADGSYAPSIAGTPAIDAILDGPRGVSIFDPAGGDYDVMLTLQRTALTAVTSAGGNDTIASATVLGGPDVYVASATLGSTAQYFSVDLGAGAIGHHLRVETRAGDPLTDTRITVVREDLTSLLGPPSSDVGDLDVLLTPSIAFAGRDYVRIEPGSAFDPAHTSFALLVTLEP